MTSRKTHVDEIERCRVNFQSRGLTDYKNGERLVNCHIYFLDVFIYLWKYSSRSGSRERFRDESRGRREIQMCFAAPIDNMVGLVTVEAILTSRQLREKLQCLYKNLMPNNLCKTAVLRSIWIVN